VRAFNLQAWPHRQDVGTLHDETSAVIMFIENTQKAVNRKAYRLGYCKQPLHMTMATTAAAVARTKLTCIFSDEEVGGHKVASWASVNVDLGTFNSKIGRGNPPTNVSRTVDKSLLHFLSKQTLIPTLKLRPAASLIPPLRATSKRRPISPMPGILIEAPATMKALVPLSILMLWGEYEKILPSESVKLTRAEAGLQGL